MPNGQSNIPSAPLVLFELLNDVAAQPDSRPVTQLKDVHPFKAIQQQAQESFNPAAFKNTGTGFKAIVLRHIPSTDPGATTGTARIHPPWLQTTIRTIGAANATPESMDTLVAEEQAEAIVSTNVLNGPQFKVWIPIMDTDIAYPSVIGDSAGASVANIELYSVATILNEDLAQKSIPVGSLVWVDYEQRDRKQGLVCTGIINSDSTFAQQIMQTLAVGLSAFGAFGCESALNGVQPSAGDSIGTTHSVQLLDINGDKLYPYDSDITEYNVIVFYHGTEIGKDTGQRQATILDAIETYIKPDMPSNTIIVVPYRHDKDYASVVNSIERFKQNYGVTIESISLGFWGGGSAGGTSALNSMTLFNKIVAADPSTTDGLIGEPTDSRWQTATSTAQSFNMYYRTENWPTDPQADYLRNFEIYTGHIHTAGGTLQEYLGAGWTGNFDYNHYDIMINALKELI